MTIHWDRLKLLAKKRSIGGWILFLLAGSWKRLGDWQNVEWLQRHLLPIPWPKLMLHPNYLTFGFIASGFAWFSAILLWPRSKGKDESVFRGPEIYLLWKPGDIWRIGSKGQQLFVENRSTSQDAYKLRIEEISIDRSRVVKATFAEINLLERGKRRAVEVEIKGKVHPEYTNDFEMVYAEATDVPPEFEYQDENGIYWVRFPIVVYFEEYGRTKYRSTFEFKIDRSRIGLETQIDFVKCQKIRN